MEALSELFFDNLASLLSITSLVLGFYVNVIVVNTANSWDESGEYGEAIKNVYTKYYYERVIPGVGFALLFGNFYYGYMAGGLRAIHPCQCLCLLSSPLPTSRRPPRL